MQRSMLSLIILAALAGGGWFFNQKFEIVGLDDITFRPRGGAATGKSLDYQGPPVKRTNDQIRIASLNIQVFGTSKAKKKHVMEILAKVIRRFDVVAIQEIRAERHVTLMRDLLDSINADGRRYNYVIGPRLGRTVSKEQYAFIFDTASIEVDRAKTYTVADPDDRLHRAPLVSWFRVRGPPADQAFTFKLINIHTDPNETKTELNALDDVVYAVRKDGDNEDDVILLGDLNVDDKHLGELGTVPYISWLISGVPTNTRGTRQYDNLLLNREATVEFTGRGGVMDLLREYNLTMEQALEVSDHMPIWAEFSIYENGLAGPVAPRPDRLTPQ